MAYDEELAARVRSLLGGLSDITEKKMFGGLTFMLGDRMCCGVVNGDFMARVGPDRYDDALAQPGARPMDFTGRPLKGMVFVGPDGHRDDTRLGGWVDQCVEFANSAQ